MGEGGSAEIATAATRLGLNIPSCICLSQRYSNNRETAFRERPASPLEKRMTNPTLPTAAEERAQAATKFDAFAVNLVDVRRTVAEILGQIGRFGFFNSYTKHNISHVDGMLRQLDWLIPETTRGEMSSADWLMTVLGIYFHDLGHPSLRPRQIPNPTPG
jgi:hypothetical protein